MIYSKPNSLGTEKLNNTTPDKNSETKILTSANSPNSMSKHTTPVKHNPPTTPTNEALPAFTDKANAGTPKPSPNRKRRKPDDEVHVLKTTTDTNILNKPPRKSEHTSQIYGNFDSLITNMTDIAIVQKIGQGNDGDVFVAEIKSTSEEKLVAMKILVKKHKKELTIPEAEGIIRQIKKNVEINSEIKECVFMPLMDGSIGKEKKVYDTKEISQKENNVDIFNSNQDHILIELKKFLLAVDTIHKENIFHRDIRLKNILFSKDEKNISVYLADFDSAIKIETLKSESVVLTSLTARSVADKILNRGQVQMPDLPTYVVQPIQSPNLTTPTSKIVSTSNSDNSNKRQKLLQPKIKIVMPNSPPRAYKSKMEQDETIMEENKFTIQNELAMVLTCLLELVFFQSFKIETNMNLIKNFLNKITESKLNLTSTLDELKATYIKKGDQELLEDIVKRIQGLKTKFGDKFTLNILDLLNLFWEKLRSEETNFNNLLADIIAKLENKERTCPLEGSSSKVAFKKSRVFTESKNPFGEGPFGRPPSL